MKLKFITQLLVATLALSGIIMSTTRAQAKSDKAGNGEIESSQVKEVSSNQQTTFYCGRAGSYFATFAQRGPRRTGPMIVWKSDAFGPEFPPKERCQQVSARFTSAVKDNGGTLRNLLLTSGQVNGQTVVCFVNTAESCNNRNVLFSLKPENASRSGDVIAKLLRFSQRGGGGPVFESGGGNGQNYVKLEDVVNKAFESGGSSENTSNVAKPSVPNTDNTPEPKPTDSI